MRHYVLKCGLLAATLACGLAASALGAELQLAMPPSARMGEPIPVAVRLIGNKHGATVALHYRGLGASSYVRQTMTEEEDGRWSTTIPATATRTPELRYWVEAQSRDDSTRIRVGAPEAPLPLMLFEAREESASGGILLKGLLLLLAIGSVAGGLWYRERRRRERLIDQLFWRKTLDPLLALPARAAAEEAARLAGNLIEHPVKGASAWSPEEILARLAEVRTLDVAALESERRRRLGPEWESLAPPAPAPVAAPVAVPVEEQVAVLAARIGRVSAAAWFLTHSRGKDGATTQEFVQPLMEALEAIRRAKQMVKQGQAEEARKLVAVVEAESQRVERAVAAAEEASSPEEFAWRLATARSMTADDLGRLFEYHALAARRTPANRHKVIEVGLALAARDAMDATNPENVQRSLARHKLMGGTIRDKLNADAAARATALREEILGGEPADSRALELARARVEALEELMGRGFYTLRGLSEAISLEAAVRGQAEALERRQLGSLDLSTSELDSELLCGSQTMALMAAAAEDPLVATLLDDVEHALREAVAKDDCPDRGFYLEDIEMIAAQPDPRHPRWANLVVRGATCRTAIDRLARQHARAAQPDGIAPPPLPQDLARGLVRAAVTLEADLQDQIERDLRHGEPARARETSRMVHRLSRARLGLAVLGGFGANGQDDGIVPALDQESEPALAGAVA